MHTLKMRDDLIQFLDYLFNTASSQQYYEFRIVGVTDFRIYKVLEKFCANNIILKNGCCLFVNKKNYKTLYSLLLHPLILNNSKPCYSLNPRYIIDDNIGGGYDYIKYVDKIFLDVEFCNGFDNQTQLDKFCDEILKYLKRYNLISYVKISSGVGRHLIFKINKKKISDGTKLWYKEFIEELCSRFNNEFMKIDRIIDFTRVAGIPGTLNVKRQKTVEILHYDDKINDFKLLSTRKKKMKVSGNIKIPLDSGMLKAIMMLLKTPMSEDAETNNVLFYHFKLLLSKHAKNVDMPWETIVEKFRPFVREVEVIQRFKFPMNRPDPELFVSKARLNGFCEENKLNYKF